MSIMEAVKNLDQLVDESDPDVLYYLLGDGSYFY